MFLLNIFRKKLFYICIIFTAVVCAGVVSATSITPIWPWNTYTARVISSDPATRPGEYWCYSTVVQKHYVAGYSSAQNVCMMANSSVRFGLVNLGYGVVAVIGFGNDSQLHQIDNICNQIEECLYLPETDILVTKKFGLVNEWNRSLVIYKNFSNRLSSHFDAPSLSTHYSFDNSNPDYVFQTGNNYAWPINGLGASNNGKWLAVEIKSRALALLNLDTLYMKRISTDNYTYRAGNDPYSELAVSNDGAHIAWMGYNASLELYENSDSCGDEASNNNLVQMNNILKQCDTARFQYSDLISDFRYASWPNYSDDGGALSFFAFSKSGNSRKVIAGAPGYIIRSLNYLAMGDSYSSGEGELEDQYYVAGTNSEYEKCHTSSRSYPFIISSLLGHNLDDMRSVACSGAKTIDVVGSDTGYYGQWNRLGLGNLGLGELDLASYQSQALELFIPGRVHQNSFANLYQPSVVTIGIGGNDANFMGKLMDCLGPTTCDWAGTEKGKEQTAVEIKNQFTKLVNTYKQIREASAKSRVYAIGYPKIINPDGDCSNLVDFLFDSAEKKFIVENILYLNRVVAAAAGAAGVKYIDIYDSFGDHAICGDANSAMNTIQLGDDMGPFDNYKWLRFIGQESFHPNALGHSLTAAMIVDKAGDILANSSEVISQTNEIAPEPPLSLLPNGYHSYPVLSSKNFVQGRSEPSINRKLSLSFPDYSFAPNSPVSVGVGNDTLNFIAYISSSTGSLDVNFDLPPELPYELQVIHVVGETFSDESVEYYDTIDYWDPTVPEVDIIVPVEQPNDSNQEPNTQPNNTQESSDKEIATDKSPNGILPETQSNNISGLTIFDNYDSGYQEVAVLAATTNRYLPSSVDDDAKNLSTDNKNKSFNQQDCNDFERILLIIILAFLLYVIFAYLLRRIIKIYKNRHGSHRNV